MNVESLAPLAVLLLSVTTLVLLTSPDWRLSIAVLALQYIGVFVLVTVAWPMAMSVTKLVTGWIAGAVLGMSISGLTREIVAASPELTPSKRDSDSRSARDQRGRPRLINWIVASTQLGSRLSGRLFRFFTAAMVGLAVFSVAPSATDWISGLTVEQAWGGLMLIGMGLLQLGFAPAALQTILGLLTVAAGFEIFYAAVETSTLVAGLLSMINLGLALVGAYLLVAPHMEKEE
jgi:hypothetical protein